MELWQLLVVAIIGLLGYVLGSWVSWSMAEEEVYRYLTKR